MRVFEVNLLLFAGLALAFVHFSVPLAYYAYARTRWLGRPWDIAFDPSFKPRVTVIVPTYNEAHIIEGKLENIFSQEYPQELLEVLIVDSSSDDTLERALKWAGNKGFNVKVLREPSRRGKARALNEGLKEAGGDIIVLTDADSLWAPGALAKAVQALSDPRVGAVSCIKKPLSEDSVEHTYREYYNVLRVAESKAYATTIFHGELAAFKRNILEKLGGFPEDIGADDSYTAAITALEGYRAVILESVECSEKIPQGPHYHWWRLRRAQHLTQNFTKLLKHIPKAPKNFKPILTAEAYLHTVNPWLLPLATILLIAPAMKGSILATLTLTLGLLLLPLKTYRTWMQTQIYLMIALIRNLWNKELVWKKLDKA